MNLSMESKETRIDKSVNESLRFEVTDVEKVIVTYKLNCLPKFCSTLDFSFGEVFARMAADRQGTRSRRNRN